MCGGVLCPRGASLSHLGSRKLCGENVSISICKAGGHFLTEWLVCGGPAHWGRHQVVPQGIRKAAAQTTRSKPVRGVPPWLCFSFCLWGPAWHPLMRGCKLSQWLWLRCLSQQEKSNWDTALISFILFSKILTLLYWIREFPQPLSSAVKWKAQHSSQSSVKCPYYVLSMYVSSGDAEGVDALSMCWTEQCSCCAFNLLSKKLSKARWWCTPLITTLRRWRQLDLWVWG